LDANQHINQLRAILVSGPQDVRDKLWKAKASDCISACVRVRSLGDGVLLETLTITIKSLATRWLALSTELKELDKKLEELTTNYAVQLRARFGVGPNTAACVA